MAGAASIIKLCKAFEARTVPPQFNFESPNPAIQLAGSPFTIPVTACAWPANVDGLPRRGAVNGFGFGGTNAHVILEAYDPSYHDCLTLRSRREPARTTLVVVAVGSQFAAEEGLAVAELPPETGGGVLRRKAMRLPMKKRLLPDALEQMDTAQFLALMSTERALQQLGDWTALRERIGVVLGLAGKTARAVAASERIYLDRLRRVLRERRREFRLDDVDFERLYGMLLNAISHDNIPSNPYTLVGMMPNVAAGRTANVFELNGPNMVVDSGATSALEALRVAELWLAFGDADLVVAGGLDTTWHHHPGRTTVDAEHGEGACVLALSTPEIARAHGWPVVASLSVGGPGDDTLTVRGLGALDLPVSLGADIARPPHRLTGVRELARAIEVARRGGAATLRWRGADQPTLAAASPVVAQQVVGTRRSSAARRVSGTVGSSNGQRGSGAFAPNVRRRSGVLSGPMPEFAELTIADGGTAFTFPGQGSYDGRTLRELYALMPQCEVYFEQADSVARRYLGQPFLPLVRSKSLAEHDEHLRRSQDLDQLGMILSGVLIAEALQERGVRPDVLMGHSFGEVTALAAGGAFDMTTAFEIAAQSVLALRTAPDVGGMMALSCAPERAHALIESLGLTSSITFAIINQPRQTVIAGSRAALTRIEAAAPRHGISPTTLASRYPFHSPLLAPAAERLHTALRQYTYSAPRIQVYSPIERGLYTARTDFPHALASNYVRSFDFRDAVTTLRGTGVSSFIECGAGAVLTKLVRWNLAGEQEEIATTPLQPEQSVVAGLLAVAAMHAAARGRQSAPEVQTKIAAPATPIIVPSRPSLSASPDDAGREVAGSIGYPVAIVGIGSVLPGASDPDHYWRNIMEGVSGIIDLASVTSFAEDFVSPGDVRPDKTYSTLGGYAGDARYDPRLPYTAQEFAALARAQQLLALAMGQATSGLRSARIDARRACCILGSSAEGIREYDEAVLVERLRDMVAGLDEPESLRASFADGVGKLPEYRSGDPEQFASYPCLPAVIERFVGVGVDTALLDVACASALYAVDIGLRRLWNHDCDVAFAGGVFSPGPLIVPLFAQFKGLSSTGCFPFDERADGVIFSEGAAVLALKRLPDAIGARADRPSP